VERLERASPLRGRSTNGLKDHCPTFDLHFRFLAKQLTPNLLYNRIIPESMKLESLTVKQYTKNPLFVYTYLITWIEAFLFDRKAQVLTEGKLYSFHTHLNLFTEF
jgi:hypothetical protein